MKNDVMEYANERLMCQKIKVEHKHPVGELKPIEIPEWKQNRVALCSVVGLPKTVEGYDVN